MQGSRLAAEIPNPSFDASFIFQRFFFLSFFFHFFIVLITLEGWESFYIFIFFFKNMRIFRVFKKIFFGLVLDSQIGWESNALLNSILFGLSRNLQPFLHFGHNHILGFVVLMICWGIAPILKMVWWLGSGSFGIVMDGILLKIE